MDDDFFSCSRILRELSAVRQLAGQSVAAGYYAGWLSRHPGNRYASMTLNDAIAPFVAGSPQHAHLNDVVFDRFARPRFVYAAEPSHDHGYRIVRFAGDTAAAFEARSYFKKSEMHSVFLSEKTNRVYRFKPAVLVASTGYRAISDVSCSQVESKANDISPGLREAALISIASAESLGATLKLLRFDEDWTRASTSLVLSRVSAPIQLRQIALARDANGDAVALVTWAWIRRDYHKGRNVSPHLWNAHEWYEGDDCLLVDLCILDASDDGVISRLLEGTPQEIWDDVLRRIDTRRRARPRDTAPPSESAAQCADVS